MARYRNESRGLQTKSARSVEVVRKALPEGKVRCGACDAVTSLTPKSRRLRKHRTPRGEACPNIISGEAPVWRLDVLPDVVIPAPSGGPRRSTIKRPEHEPSRLDGGTGCRECGKWLPGERSLCGACYVKREARR